MRWRKDSPQIPPKAKGKDQQSWKESFFYQTSKCRIFIHLMYSERWHLLPLSFNGDLF